MYINMESSEKEVADKIAIPAVYVTIADGQKLWNAGEVNVEVSACVLLSCLLNLSCFPTHSITFHPLFCCQYINM